MFNNVYFIKMTVECNIPAVNSVGTSLSEVFGVSIVSVAVSAVEASAKGEK